VIDGEEEAWMDGIAGEWSADAAAGRLSESSSRRAGVVCGGSGLRQGVLKRSAEAFGGCGDTLFR
jgi:hypothetical protein